MYWDDLDSEKEEELINKTAKIIIRNDLETAALLIFESLKAGSYIGGQFARVYLAPILPLIGENAYDFLTLIERKNNIDRIVFILDKSLKEKEEKAREKKKKQKKLKEKNGSWVKKIIKKFYDNEKVKNKKSNLM